MSESEGETPRHALPAELIHNLRTPLNHIIGYSELLIEQAQEQGRDDFVPDLQKTHAAGQQLLSIINDNFHSRASAETRVPSSDDLTATRLHSTAAEAQGFLLVVDDVQNNRDVLSRRLERQGYAVVTAEDGKQALEKLRAQAFDLVLLDIMMPEMDGYEVLQRLKADEALRHIPVIMISALSELDSVVRCIGLGAEDYLSKPFEPTLLKARIGACLEKKRARDREQKLAAALHAQNVEMAAWRAAQEADLAIARTTQQAIVTSPIPRLDRWQVETLYTPLIQIGGDVYGWRQLADGACLFWLADATGHGVAAALFTTFVALLFNHASAETKTAHEILTRVNAEFYSVLRGKSFMAACCVVVEANGRLSFAGAGHPPLLIRRREGSVEALASQGTLMGIHASAAIEELSVTLAPGDVALLYSDGLYSLRSAGGGRLASEKLAESFRQLGDEMHFLPKLIAELVLQSDEHGFDDDVAAIALRRP
ncbi:MAG: SpoIIE family protein phosphatase [Verrucomicrobiota bacterium]|nr:SpoIIE family protein phosphatase [Verrucomicrobiota bacterium]